MFCLWWDKLPVVLFFIMNTMRRTSVDAPVYLFYFSSKVFYPRSINQYKKSIKSYELWWNCHGPRWATLHIWRCSYTVVYRHVALRKTKRTEKSKFIITKIKKKKKLNNNNCTCIICFFFSNFEMIFNAYFFKSYTDVLMC
jgi:hypothetical protein